MNNLKDCVCLVTGASRGIGRGVAIALGKHGARVYITSRKLGDSGDVTVKGTLRETAHALEDAGGIAIPIAVDHADEKQVTELFERIRKAENGRLDLLVNCAFSGMNFLMKNRERACHQIDDCTPGEAWDSVNLVGLRNNYVCMVNAIRLMLDWQNQPVGHNEDQNQSTTTTTTQTPRRPGLIVNLCSPGAIMYMFNALYGTGKAAVDRLTADMARELKREKANISLVSLWSNEVRTEEFVSTGEKFMVNEWLTFDMKDAYSPELIGNVIAQLAMEPAKKLLARSGQITLTSDVALEYGMHEPDGRVPCDARSLRTMLTSAGYRRSNWIPRGLRAPLWLYYFLLRSR